MRVVVFDTGVAPLAFPASFWGEKCDEGGKGGHPGMPVLLDLRLTKSVEGVILHEETVLC